MLGLVPVWVRCTDDQIWERLQVKTRDFHSMEALPQYDQALVFSISPITLHGGVGRARQASVPLMGAVLLKKKQLGAFLVVECCYSAIWGSADFHGIIFRYGTAVPSRQPLKSALILIRVSI